MSRIYRSENVFLGTLGSFLFSLICPALWFISFKFTHLALFCGVGTIVCAIAGYEWLAKGVAFKSVKKFSLKGVLISLAISVAVLILTWHLGLAKDIYNLARDNYISAPCTYAQALGNPYYLLFREPYSITVFYILRLVECLFGCIGFGVVFAAVCKEDYEEEAAKVKAKLNGKPTSWDE